MTYTFVCQQGHDPLTMTVEADNDDMAMTEMMTKAKEHLAAVHSGGPQMTDDQVKAMIQSGWTKA